MVSKLVHSIFTDGPFKFAGKSFSIYHLLSFGLGFIHVFWLQTSVCTIDKRYFSVPVKRRHKEGWNCVATIVYKFWWKTYWTRYFFGNISQFHYVLLQYTNNMIVQFIYIHQRHFFFGWLLVVYLRTLCLQEI